MINLLPTKDKEILLKERKKRIVIILWLLLLFFLLCLILILFSIKLYLQGQINIQKSFLAETEKEFLQSEAQELQAKIELANSSFKEISSFYKERIYFSEILEKISETIPENFYLTNLAVVFSIKKEKEEEKEFIAVSLSGFAPLREELLGFKKKLENEDYFKEISFPASNWVEKKDINFNVSFKIFP